MTFSIPWTGLRECSIIVSEQSGKGKGAFGEAGNGEKAGLKGFIGRWDQTGTGPEFRRLPEEFYLSFLNEIKVLLRKGTGRRRARGNVR